MMDMSLELKLEEKNKGYKKISEEIINKYNLEAESIVLDGYKKAEKIKNDANIEIEAEVQRILNKAEKIESGRKNKIISSVEIDIRRTILLKRNEIIENILEKVIEELKNFVNNSPEYKNYLLNYIEQGLITVANVKDTQIENKRTEAIKFCTDMKLNQENIIDEEFEINIFVNPRDKKNLSPKETEILKKKCHHNLKIIEDDNIIGGAKIITSDNTISFENTIRNRLEQRRTDIITKISDILWA